MASQDEMMLSPQPPEVPKEEPTYGGYSRFELELEVSFPPPPICVATDSP